MEGRRGGRKRGREEGRNRGREVGKRGREEERKRGREEEEGKEARTASSLLLPYPFQSLHSLLLL